MNIYGKHQVMNALPCIYIARALGMSEAQILEGLADIEQTGLRCDLVALGAGYVLDDSYKSNRQSVLAALDTLCEFDIPRRIAILSAQGAINAGVKDVTHYETKEALQEAVLEELDAPCILLVKGSRGMQMDSIVTYLKERRNRQHE